MRRALSLVPAVRAQRPVRVHAANRLHLEEGVGPRKRRAGPSAPSSISRGGGRLAGASPAAGPPPAGVPFLLALLSAAARVRAGSIPTVANSRPYRPATASGRSCSCRSTPQRPGPTGGRRTVRSRSPCGGSEHPGRTPDGVAERGGAEACQGSDPPPSTPRPVDPAAPLRTRPPDFLVKPLSGVPTVNVAVQAIYAGPEGITCAVLEHIFIAILAFRSPYPVAIGTMVHRRHSTLGENE